MTTRLTLYIDYRSPFSYIVTRDALALEREFDIDLQWQPYTIDLEGAYGGRVDQRTERDWRKVRYQYADARRLANQRGLTVLGPLKIFNPLLAHIGMLLALDAGRDVFERYHLDLCTRFWRREVDIEDQQSVKDAAVRAGVEAAIFDEAVATGQGSRRCHAITKEAEALGVFGVPTFVLHDPVELFWGVDRVSFVHETLSNEHLRTKKTC